MLTEKLSQLALKPWTWRNVSLVSLRGTRRVSSAALYSWKLQTPMTDQYMYTYVWTCVHVLRTSAGVLPVEELFKDLRICDSLKPKCIQLLEKFEIALSIGSSQVCVCVLVIHPLLYETHWVGTPILETVLSLHRWMVLYAPILLYIFPLESNAFPPSLLSIYSF